MTNSHETMHDDLSAVVAEQDPETLAKIASGHSDPNFRAVATRLLVDKEILLGIAEKDSDKRVRNVAEEALRSLQSGRCAECDAALEDLQPIRRFSSAVIGTRRTKTQPNPKYHRVIVDLCEGCLWRSVKKEYLGRVKIVFFMTSLTIVFGLVFLSLTGAFERLGDEPLRAIVMLVLVFVVLIATVTIGSIWCIRRSRQRRLDANTLYAINDNILWRYGRKILKKRGFGRAWEAKTYYADTVNDGYLLGLAKKSLIRLLGEPSRAVSGSTILEMGSGNALEHRKNDEFLGFFVDSKRGLTVLLRQGVVAEVRAYSREKSENTVA